MNANHDKSHFSTAAREWIWPVALAASIFFASGRSQIAAPDVPGIDKIAHFFVYGLLGTLIARVTSVAKWRWLGVYWAIVICSLYGISDEFHQSFTPGRSIELFDWAMDTGGAALAVTLYVRWKWYGGLLEQPLAARSRVEIASGTESDS